MSALVPNSVIHNFPSFSYVHPRRKALPKLTQIQESNLDSRNEIIVRSNPPLHSQFDEISIDPKDDLNLPTAIRKAKENALSDHSHYLSVSLKCLSPIHKNFIVRLHSIVIHNVVSKALLKRE